MERTARQDGAEPIAMPVYCNVHDPEHRVREVASGRIARNKAGTPLDGGGHGSHAACMAQARAVNANLAESRGRFDYGHPVRLQEATRAGRAFSGSVSRNLQGMNRLDREALQRVTDLLRDAWHAISARIADVPTFEAWYLPQLRGEVARAFGDFQSRYADDFEKYRIRAEGLATSLVQEPLARIGFEVTFPTLPSDFLAAMGTFHADQIKGLGDQAIKDASTVLSMGMMGGLGKNEVIANLSRLLPTPAGAGTIAGRAKRIVRTEINRIHAAVTQKRMEQAVEQGVPELKKYWLAAYRNTRPSHLEAAIAYDPAHAIPVSEPFRLAGGWAMYPRDPALPADEVVNCMCRAVPVVPEVAPPDPMAQIKEDAVRLKKQESVDADSLVSVGQAMQKDIERRTVKSVTDADKRRPVLQKQSDAALKKLDAFGKKRRPLLEELGQLRQTAEGAASSRTVALDRELAALHKQSEKLWTEYYAAQDELQTLQQAVGLAKQKAVTDALGEIRPLGYVAQRTPAGQVAHPVVQANLEEVAKALPEEWFRRSRDYGDMLVRETRAGDPYRWRSFYHHRSAPGYGEMAVAVERETIEISAAGRRAVIEARRPHEIQSAAIHEFGHRVEDISPRISRATDEFWRHRTGTESWEKLADIEGPSSSYGEDEVTKKDKFTSPYMGKRYGRTGSEILTMGLEGVFLNRYNLWNLDPEYVQFILGVLSVL